MFGMNGKKMGPIGVDLGSGYLRMVQLGKNGQGLFMQAAGLSTKPESIDFRSPAWQHWACESTQQLLRENDFRGKSIVTALPSDDFFIDPIPISASSLGRIQEILPQKLQKRLPFPVENALFQHVVINPGEKSNSDVVDVLTISVNRESINQHLAIYEKVGLDVASISIWPTAMINSFVQFFCRRENEFDIAAILINVGTNHTNVVITRGPNLLFGRSRSDTPNSNRDKWCSGCFLKSTRVCDISKTVQAHVNSAGSYSWPEPEPAEPCATDWPD